MEARVNRYTKMPVTLVTLVTRRGGSLALLPARSGGMLKPRGSHPSRPWRGEGDTTIKRQIGLPDRKIR